MSWSGWSREAQRRLRAPTLLRLLALGLLLAAVVPAGAEDEGEVGESLFDDDEVAAWKEKQEDAETEEGTASGVDNANVEIFDSAGRSLSADIVFDEQGNVKEGGSTDFDLTMWHIVEFNGEEIFEPTDGSTALLEALEKGDSYTVKFAPPGLDKFKCTEKVEPIFVVFERFSHELSPEFLERSRAILENEGVSNTKQLGELEEKDYDAIPLPALIKSRLRKVREEAREQSAVAAKKVEMDGQEVQEELRQFMEARSASRGAEAPQQAAKEEAPPAEAAAEAVVPEEEEDGTFKSLVWAIMNCPTCKGKETVTCFRNCRYGQVLGEEGKTRTWSECLDKCVTNRFLRATIGAMLPRSV